MKNKSDTRTIQVPYWYRVLAVSSFLVVTMSIWFAFYYVFAVILAVGAVYVLADLCDSNKSKDLPTNSKTLPQQYKDLVKSFYFTITNGFWFVFFFLRGYLREATAWFGHRTPIEQRNILLFCVVSFISIVVMWALVYGITHQSHPDVGSVNNASVKPMTSLADEELFTGTPYSELIPVPLGKYRYKLNDEQLKWRESKMIDTRIFWIMREDGAIKGAKRITSPEYQKFLTEASEKYGVDKATIEAIHFLESFGKEDAKSHTGPVGPGQFTVQTAANLGEVKLRKCLLLLEGQVCGELAPKNTKKIAEDNRQSVELSVFATAKLLKQEQDFFGKPDFAIAAYHSSRGKVADWVKKYLEPKPVKNGGASDILGHDLEYGQMYFRATPYYNPGTYQKYRDLMEKDWGANYVWKITCAKNLLQLYRTDQNAFRNLVAKNRYFGDKARYRMWTFYNDERDKADTVHSLADLKAKILEGDLVTLPNDQSEFGFKLRLDGPGAIAELDRTNQQSYIATKKETAGALLWLGKSLKYLRPANAQFALDITSVTRTVQYQHKLTKQNPTATKKLSFHVLGSAFDIARNSLSPSQERDVLFLLDELDSTGLISWVPENDAFHVVVNPEGPATQFFTGIYLSVPEFHIQPVVDNHDWQ